MSLQPHERILPAFDISEEGLRQLEIWLLERLGRGGGLQYHKGIYGPHNIGDWLWVESTALGTQDLQDAEVQGGQPGMLFQADSVNAAGAGIVFWAHDTVLDRDIIQQVTASGIVYFLDGQDDFGFTQGGDIVRQTGGGGVTFYTTDSGFPNAGDFQVNTQGTSDDSAITTGAIQLDTRNFSGGTSGQIRSYSGSTISENLAADGATYVIKDHLGSPLVTYTG